MASGAQAMPRKPIPCKLVLLGESAVGKSSLVMRFAKDHFDEHKESTIGASFLSQSVTLEDGTVVKFDIWDTAGQERYKSLAPMYYRQTDCAIVVYDITQPSSLEKAKDWIKELDRHLDHKIVIALVGNKTDLGAKRAVETTTAQLYAEENGLLFLETSAKSADGVHDVFTEIAKRARDLPCNKTLPNAPLGLDLNNNLKTSNGCAC